MSEQSKSKIPRLNLPADTPILKEFNSEALHLLISADNALYNLETMTTAPGSIGQLFKVFHTIKGLSSFLELHDIYRLSETAEKIMDWVRKGQIDCNGNLVLTISMILSALRKLLLLLNEQIDNQGALKSPYPDITNLLDEISYLPKRGRDNSKVEQPLRVESLPDNPRGSWEKSDLLMQEREEALRLRDNALKLRERAEKTAQQKTELLAHMAHEIRNLVNAILGFSKILQASTLTDKQREQLGTIVSSSQLLLEVVNDVLDISRTESGKIKVETLPFNLRELVGNILGICRTQAESKSIICRATIDENVPEDLIGDTTKLRQILINLFTNALKFTEKGEVELRVRCRDGNPDGPTAPMSRVTLEFNLRDTGIGIAPDKINKLFQSFSQADSSIPVKYGGSGLGLSICKNLVNLMGGEIWVESSPNVGSCFIFTLTFAISSRRSQDLPKIPTITLTDEEIEKTSLKGLRVLVVDDSLANLELMQAYFEEMLCQGDFVTSGREAIELIRHQQYHICLMDLQLPQLDGISTTKIIREQLKMDFPIIALTGEENPSEISRALAAGINDTILKPIDMLALKKKIIFYTKAGEK